MKARVGESKVVGKASEERMKENERDGGKIEIKVGQQ